MINFNHLQRLIRCLKASIFQYPSLIYRLERTKESFHSIKFSNKFDNFAIECYYDGDRKENNGTVKFISGWKEMLRLDLISDKLF